MKHIIPFHKQLQNELKGFIDDQSGIYPADELLKIDLHCHDFNSNVPDELLGRILGVPETWLKSEDLIKSLEKFGCTAFTVTNHNNSRSCYELREKGFDVLVAAEFSVTVPDFEVGIHVLTFGFTQEQEKHLNKLRYNVYDFLQYTHKHDIPTIWAHPLYHYTTKELPTFDFFNKMALIFERFEVLNGQRDTWQNMLVKNWISTLTPDVIERNAKKFDIDLSLYTNRPYQKSMSGGSDDHMGIFAGHTGSYLYVPNLKERLLTTPKSELALEAIKKHRMIPYGGHQNIEKLTIAFLDYVFQVAMHMEKPDLLRMVLHKGTSQDKMIAIVVANLFSELRRHKTTMRFVKLLHKSFVGKRSVKFTEMMVNKSYKSIFKETVSIVDAHDMAPEKMTEQFYKAINSISNQLNSILFDRLQTKIKLLSVNENFTALSLDEALDQIKLSPIIRDFIEGTSRNDKKQKRKITDFLDGLTFPFLSSALILAANFASSKVLYNNRKLLSNFSEELGKLHHPKRMLWLSDTFDDKNGVSSVLQEMHREVKRLNLPIDFLVCSNTVKPDDHLIVMKPEAELTLPFYQQQTFRIPNINKIHALFLENEYDRLICSTEGVMGFIAVLLKNAYSVPAYFYMHTDWIMFARKVMKWDNHGIDRVRRSLRMFYGNFDRLFVLNTDHRDWLAGREMEYDSANISMTAHWVDQKFMPVVTSKLDAFNLDKQAKVLLFAGRLSIEKGVMDVVEVFQMVQLKFSDVQMVFAGVGPAEAELRQQLPNAIFLGWVDNDKLPAIYSAADMLLLPSTFDTFGLVVLEALSCGLPVAAFDAKGPKDIIEHNVCGYIAKDANHMAECVIGYLSDEGHQNRIQQNAIDRAKHFSKDDIMRRFIEAIDLA